MLKPSQEVILVIRTISVTASKGKLLYSMENDRNFLPQTLQEGDLEHSCMFSISTHHNLPTVSCSQNCRVTEWLKLEVNLFNHCLNRDTYSKFSMVVYRWLLGISKDKVSTTSLEKRCQCSATLTEKMCFLTFRQNLLCFNLCPEPLVLSLYTTEKVWFPYFCTLPSGIYLYQ